MNNCYAFQKEMLGKKELDYKRMMELAEKTLKSMRKDLGLSNSTLNGLFNNVIVFDRQEKSTEYFTYLKKRRISP